MDRGGPSIAVRVFISRFEKNATSFAALRNVYRLQTIRRTAESAAHLHERRAVSAECSPRAVPLCRESRARGHRKSALLLIAPFRGSLHFFSPYSSRKIRLRTRLMRASKSLSIAHARAIARKLLGVHLAGNGK